jgi:hypothetical protein
VTRTGACPCGAVRFTIDGPVRDVIVCHCDACRAANGGPWAASAAWRGDLVIEDEGALEREKAPVSAHGASRRLCRTCGAYVLWDAPGRETVSFGAALLADADELQVVAHIWVPHGEREALGAAGLRVEPEGLPESVEVPWHEGAAATG